MSSFIVQPKTINRIVTWLDNITMGEKNINNSLIVDVLQKHGMLKEKEYFEDAELEDLANAFLYLNKLATDGRYRKEHLVSVMKFEREEASETQVLKSMECLRYQASEDDIPKHKLYKLLNNLINTLKTIIIDRLPEYQKAEWS